MSENVWHGDKHKKQVKALKKKALAAIGALVEAQAVELAPVDTGRLKGSITHIETEGATHIGTNVEYAPYQEYGTSRSAAQPYLRPAIDITKPEIESIAKKILAEAKL